MMRITSTRLNGRTNKPKQLAFNDDSSYHNTRAFTRANKNIVVCFSCDDVRKDFRAFKIELDEKMAMQLLDELTRELLS
jgi:hypothetical protein